VTRNPRIIQPVAMFFTIALFACTPLTHPASIHPETALQGEAIHLPLALGSPVLFCGGANLLPESHRSAALRFDVDLGIHFGDSIPVFAPVDGRAFVHARLGPSDALGHHVNVDREDGTYVLLAHLSHVLTQDGAHLSAGDLVGYGGGTGELWGDYIHLGLHEGHPSRRGDEGLSRRTEYLVRASPNDREEQAITQGRLCFAPNRPVSALTTDLAVHAIPEKTLISYLGEAPYFLFQNGTLHRVRAAQLSEIGRRIEDARPLTKEQIYRLPRGEPLRREKNNDAFGALQILQKEDTLDAQQDP
jgi:hypothetical protein